MSRRDPCIPALSCAVAVVAAAYGPAMTHERKRSIANTRAVLQRLTR